MTAREKTYQRESKITLFILYYLLICIYFKEGDELVAKVKKGEIKLTKSK